MAFVFLFPPRGCFNLSACADISHNTSWPFWQPPAIMFGSDGENWKAWISSGASSSNWKYKGWTHLLRFSNTIVTQYSQFFLHTAVLISTQKRGQFYYSNYSSFKAHLCFKNYLFTPHVAIIVQSYVNIYMKLPQPIVHASTKECGNLNAKLFLSNQTN